MKFYLELSKTQKNLLIRIGIPIKGGFISCNDQNRAKQNPTDNCNYHCKYKWSIFTVGFRFFVFIGPFIIRTKDSHCGPN